MNSASDEANSHPWFFLEGVYGVDSIYTQMRGMYDLHNLKVKNGHRLSGKWFARRQIFLSHSAHLG